MVEELKMFLEAFVWIRTVWKTDICCENFDGLSVMFIMPNAKSITWPILPLVYHVTVSDSFKLYFTYFTS